MPFSKPHAVLAVAAGVGASVTTAPAEAAVAPVQDVRESVSPLTRVAVHAHAHQVKRNVRLARTNARLRGVRPHRTRRQVRDWSLTHLGAANRRLARKNRTLRRAAERAARQGAVTGAGVQTPGNLQAIAQCESGGNPSAVDATGTYRGKYQFDLPTWQSAGGTGDPAAAPEAVQDRVAAQLYARSGSAPWPVCGG